MPGKASLAKASMTSLLVTHHLLTGETGRIDSLRLRQVTWARGMCASSTVRVGAAAAGAGAAAAAGSGAAGAAAPHLLIPVRAGR
jgi:hypothetical protein